jgi:flagellar hook-associated protein 3 FlgL
MSPVGASTIGTAWFLNGMENLQQQQLQTQKELSSGYQIQDAADSPSQTPELINLGSTLAAVQAYQTSLGSIQTEAAAADGALGSGISLIQSAITTGEQGANSISTAANDQNLSAQIQSIQQQLVSVANTSVGGRYIFGGDSDQSAPYSYTAAAGVTSLTNAASTRVVVDTQGQPVYQSLAAQQIFGPTDATGAPTASNTFAALQSLVTALNSGSASAVADAVTSLQTAATYVNQQQAYYGQAEQRIASEQNTSASQVTSLQTRIGAIRDTNVTAAATDLTQESADQSAAYGAEAEISTKSLFDYLG